jgi:hypothetical protein
MITLIIISREKTMKKIFLTFPLALLLIGFLAACQFWDSKYNSSSPYTETESQFAMTTPFDNPDNPSEDGNSNFGDVPSEGQLDYPVDYNPDAIYEPDAGWEEINIELNDMLG